MLAWLIHLRNGLRQLLASRYVLHLEQEVERLRQENTAQRDELFRLRGMRPPLAPVAAGPKLLPARRGSWQNTIRRLEEQSRRQAEEIERKRREAPTTQTGPGTATAGRA